MPRFHNVDGVRVQFTQAEETQRDVEEQAFEDGKVPGAWANVRRERDKLLVDSDYTQLDDSPRDKVAWKNYRQALRDITLQADPNNITWPDEPA